MDGRVSMAEVARDVLAQQAAGAAGAAGAEG
jgi:hypothetical protein